MSEQQPTVEQGTVRADGSVRKTHKIRPGYNPPHLQQKYVPPHMRGNETKTELAEEEKKGFEMPHATKSDAPYKNLKGLSVSSQSSFKRFNDRDSDKNSVELEQQEEFKLCGFAKMPPQFFNSAHKDDIASERNGLNMWRSIMIKECDSSQQSAAHQSSGGFSSKAQDAANQSGTPQISQESSRHKNSGKKLTQEIVQQKRELFSEGGMWEEEYKKVKRQKKGQGYLAKFQQPLPKNNNYSRNDQNKWKQQVDCRSNYTNMNQKNRGKQFHEGSHATLNAEGKWQNDKFQELEQQTNHIQSQGSFHPCPQPHYWKNKSFGKSAYNQQWRGGQSRGGQQSEGNWRQ